MVPMMRPPLPPGLQNYLGQRWEQTTCSAAAPLVEAIQQRCGDALEGVVFYGSILHGLSRPDETLFDFMVVVSSYRLPCSGWGHSLANWLLPPNVYYLEAAGPDGTTLRCKYTIIARRDLDRMTSLNCRQVYFWGRCAQPTALGWVRNDATRDALLRIMAQATTTFCRRVLCLQEETFSAAAFWVRGLAACYGSELRPEDSSRARSIVERDQEHYRTLSLLVLPALGAGALNAAEEDPQFTQPLQQRRRKWEQLGWRRRRLEGRCLNLLRLVKAIFTFDGGVDYALWKIHRHSGETVNVSARVRRHPLIFGWPVLFSLWRRGLLSQRKAGKP